MKTRILSFLIVALGLMVSTSAFAQPTTTTVATSDSYANIGDELTYSVAAGGGVTTNFTWAIRPDAGNTGSAPTFSASTSNQQTVNWTGTTAGDIFYLDVYYIDATGCYSEMLTFQITITNAELCIAIAPGTVGATAVAAPTVTETCSLIETSTRSGNSTTATGGDVTDFYLTVTGGIPNTDYTVYYSVAGTEQTSTTVTTDNTGAGAVIVQVDFTSFAADFTNTSGSNTTVSIAATRMVDSNSFEVTSSCDFDVTVHSVPTLNF